MSMPSTIAAIATPQAAGPIGLIRISGPEARAVAARVFQPAGHKNLLTAGGYTALYGKIVETNSPPAPRPAAESAEDQRVWDAPGQPVDEAIAIVYAAPKSYTGEDVVELSCHGGLYLVQKTLALVLRAGARAAEAGEFTRRAFLNGKMGLTQAEAVMDLIGAQGEAAARAAMEAHDGALFTRIRGVTQGLLSISAHISAFVDYPEEEIPDLDGAALGPQLQDLLGTLTRLLGDFDAGRVLREGVNTVIAGKPNVGKSTLMNLLSGTERSIVTARPGTTRDIVEEQVRLGNVLLRLADTAGLRETEDPVEAIGVERARRRLAGAGFILAVFDASEPLTQEDEALLTALQGRPAVAVINKTDLPLRLDAARVEAAAPTVYVAAQSGEGKEALIQAVEQVLGTAALDFGAGMLATQRQRDCCERARAALAESLAALRDSLTLDAVQVSLEDAIAALLELTGERVTERVVETVFAQFCVGK